MDRRLPTMIALSLLSRELDARPSPDDAAGRRRRRGESGADDVLRLAATAMSVGYSVAAMANMRPSKPLEVEDLDVIPEMGDSCCDLRTDSLPSSRTESLHEDEEARAEEDKYDDVSVSSDDVSFYVGPGEGFVCSASVCESDISATDDEDSLFDDLSDDEEDLSFEISDDDEEDVPIFYSRDKSAILENPHLARRNESMETLVNGISLSCRQDKVTNPENLHLLVRKPLKERDECDAVPAMKPIDSFGSMASKYTVDDTVHGFEVTPTKDKEISTQSRSNAVWSLF